MHVNFHFTVWYLLADLEGVSGLAGSPFPILIFFWIVVQDSGRQIIVFLVLPCKMFYKSFPLKSLFDAASWPVCDKGWKKNPTLGNVLLSPPCNVIMVSTETAHKFVLAGK